MVQYVFDQIVVVDWSASSKPAHGADSIWIAVHRPGDGTMSVTNPTTRAAAADVVVGACSRAGRTLLGVDFSLGYPAGTAAALDLPGTPWRAMWALLDDLVVDRDDNSNNRFEVAAELNARLGGGPGPFWGCPPSRRGECLTSYKVDAAPLAEWRQVEAGLRAQGHRPFSSWQLLGAGAVGSQSLLGIPRLVEIEGVLRAGGRTVEVWPFADAIATARADVVIAEVWPSLYPLPPANGRVRDEVQVIETALRLSAGSGVLVDPGVDTDVAGEEGWVLGA